MTEEQYAAQQLQYTSADYQQEQSNEYVEQQVEQVYSGDDYQNQYQAPENYPAQYNSEQYETYPAEQTEQPQQDFNNSYYSQEPGENYYTDENQHQQQPISTGLDENATNNIEHTYTEPDVVNENTQQATSAVGEYYAPATGDDAYAATANAFGGVGGGGFVGDEDESSTTYSENINLPQQQMFGGSDGLLEESIPAGGLGENTSGAATTTVAPNYLESETDDSTAQQVKGIANDESDFDFSANWNIKYAFLLVFHGVASKSNEYFFALFVYTAYTLNGIAKALSERSTFDGWVDWVVIHQNTHYAIPY